MRKNCMLIVLFLAMMTTAKAQTFTQYTTTDGAAWKQMETKGYMPMLTVTDTEQGREFRAWGTCFNELDLDALELLKPEEQEEVKRNIFAPDGDLRFIRTERLSWCVTISCRGLTRTASTTSAWKISVWSILTSWTDPN